jgi:hypothetical protein
MDPKDTWPVVKFIVAAVGLKRDDARQYLDEIPAEKYPQLYLACRKWERDTEKMAADLFTEIIGSDVRSQVLTTAVERSRMPSHKQPTSSDKPVRGKKKRAE